MKSLIAFSRTVLLDMENMCRTSTDLDFKTVQARVEDEGVSFLTITLPNFGKDLQKGLDQGFVDRHLFLGFRRGKGELPAFLQGFLGLIFDASSGLLLDDPSIDAIRAVHQFTSMFGKIRLDCTPERVDAALDGFIAAEQTVRDFDRRRTPSMVSDFERVAFMLFRDVFTELDYLVYNGEVLPKHGPGATAERLRANDKWNQQEWTERLENWFPAREFLIPNWKHVDVLDSVTVLDPGSERPVRVVTVPKTLKAPRIIAIEPTCMQYMQQSLLIPMVEKLEKDDTVSSFIGFTDQVPNQEMAREGSLLGNLATLDLSEASDRVSNQLVRSLLRRFPSLAGGVDACRSRKADVPGHGVVRLAKFASMGSALCFPMEAMVFLTIVFLSIEQELGKPLTRSVIKTYRGKVRIYGDDIIIPVDMVRRVSHNLEAYGLKVNVNKSFWTGKFRESCGGDFYNGIRITPVKVRDVIPTERKQTQQIVSTVSLRNQLFGAGFYESVSALDGTLVKLLHHFPFVGPDSAALGRHEFSQRTVGKLCVSLHKPLVKAYTVKAKLPSSPLEGYGALMKFFLKGGDLPILDPEHLLFAGRPVAVDIKLRWVDPC